MAKLEGWGRILQNALWIIPNSGIAWRISSYGNSQVQGQLQQKLKLQIAHYPIAVACSFASMAKLKWASEKSAKKLRFFRRYFTKWGAAYIKVRNSLQFCQYGKTGGLGQLQQKLKLQITHYPIAVACSFANMAKLKCKGNCSKN